MNNTLPISVAIADDHELFRKGLIRILSDFSEFSFLTDAGSGKELIDNINSSNPPDICLIDICMPRMNGYETAVALRQLYPETRIVAFSLYKSELNILRMLRAGACGFINKDVELDQLRFALNTVYSDGRYFSEGISHTIQMLFQQPKKRAAFDPSDQQMRFLSYCCTELTYKEIADKMKVSIKTVDCYRDHLFQKLGVVSRTGLAIYALKAGIAQIER